MDKIYLQLDEETGTPDTWCVDQQWGSDIEYIRADIAETLRTALRRLYDADKETMEAMIQVPIDDGRIRLAYRERDAAMIEAAAALFPSPTLT